MTRRPTHHSSGPARKAAQVRSIQTLAITMPPRLFATGVVLASLLCAANAGAAVEVVPKVVAPRAAKYESISFATEGPAHSTSDGKVRGKFQRLLVLSGGLVYEHPTLRLETLTYGDEGCCRRVVEAWELDLNALPDAGLALPEAATSRLQFVRWRGAWMAEFKYGEYVCKFQGIGLPKLKVSCAK